MNRIKSASVVSFCVFLIQLTSSGQDFVGPVGQWGDPARIKIEGTRHFEPEQLKKRLAGNFHHFMASHPSAPLAGLPKSIEQQLLHGYQRAGFGEARVDVRLDFDTRMVLVQIDEGERRRAGAIRVDGPPQIRDPLTALLADRRAPDGAHPARLSDHGGVIEWADADGKKAEEEKPVWVEGLPAELDPAAAAARRKRVGQCLADLGFDQAKFESTVTANGPLADWWIRVDQLGPPAVLRTIETTGNSKNTHAEIVAYLSLRPGTIVTREFRQRLQRSLWNSARFQDSKVDMDRVPDGSGVRLKIDVREYPHAPKLTEPLSREEKAMLKHRHWLTQGLGSRMDIVVTCTRVDGRMEIILSPVDGISSCWWDSPVADGPPDFAIMATDESLSAVAFPSRRRLTMPILDQQLDAQLAMSLNEDDPEHAFRTTFGFGFESLEKGAARRPLTLSTSMPPVYFLAMVHEQAECSWQGPILSVRSKRGTVRINEQTGELIDSVSSNLEDEDIAFAYSLRPNAFARQREQIVSASAGMKNEFDGARPISTTTGFLLNTGLVSTVGGFLYGEPFTERAPQSTLSVLGKLVDRGLLAVADTVVIATFDRDENEFKLAWQPDEKQQVPAKQSYAFLVAQAADHIFPRDSWAWTLWRESALVVSGLGQYAGSELNRLMADPRCGPSSYWMLAELLNLAQRPVGPIAERGLSKFNRGAFIREWETAMGRELHPSVVATLTALRSLSDEDIAALSTLVNGPPPQWLRIADQLRSATPDRPGDVTAELLDAIWSTELRDRLERRLEQLARPNRVSGRPREIGQRQ